MSTCLAIIDPGTFGAYSPIFFTTQYFVTAEVLKVTPSGFKFKCLLIVVRLTFNSEAISSLVLTLFISPFS